jgi:subtilisin family serine protease
MPIRQLRVGLSRPQRKSQVRGVRLFGESLEARWTPAWGGVPPALISVPGGSVGVTLNSQGDATGAAAITASEVDYYSFTAAASGTYRIASTTPSSNLDTVLGLFSSGGARLAYNDDIGRSNRDSQIYVNLTAGTQYFVGITNYFGTAGGSYTWTIDGPTPTIAPPPLTTDDDYENNDTSSAASDLGLLTGNRTISNLVMADGDDWYRFSMAGSGASGSAVSLSFQHADGDLDLQVYTSSGMLVGQSTSISNSETVSLNGQSAGTYYVRAYGYRGASNPNYSLSIAPGVQTATPPVTSPTTPSAFPDVAYFGGPNDWNLNAINAPEAWAQGYTGQGAVVAVIDTGVDLNHPELVNQLWVNPGEIAGNGIDDDHNGFTDDVHGWDFVNHDNLPDDGNGHGTHVAGTIAAARDGIGPTGVAYGAEIMAIRVLDNQGSGTDADVAAGIRYAAANGADIINLSLGGGYSSSILSAIQYAQQHNVLVVAAAGNESATVPGYPARHSATLSNVISVGAYGSSNTIASFSNHVGGSGAVQVDAPGVGIYSSYLGGGMASLSGTSMATPHVAGLAALALSANPNLTASQLRTLIVDGANRAILGSDSRGGVNAAVTVALAANGQASASGSAAATTPLNSTVVTSNGRAARAALIDRYFGNFDEALWDLLLA